MGRYGRGSYPRKNTNTYQDEHGRRGAVSEGDGGDGGILGKIIDGIGDAPEALGMAFGGP